MVLYRLRLRALRGSNQGFGEISCFRNSYEREKTWYFRGVQDVRKPVTTFKGQHGSYVGDGTRSNKE